LAETIALYEQALAEMERLLGPDDPDVLAMRAGLADTYRGLGRVGEALPVFERVLADRERVLGPDHLATVTSRSRLADA
jgi:hypothetical protein